MAEAWADKVVTEARSWLGTPYRHQGMLKSVGCDCLGLVRGVWAALYGEEPEAAPGYSSDWAEATGVETMLAAARRHLVERDPTSRAAGDVLIFRWRPHLPAKHAGILTGPSRLLHAYQAAGRVAEVALVHQWETRVVAAFAFPEPDGDA